MFFGILPGYCHFITRNTQPYEGSLLFLSLHHRVPSLWQQPSIGYCAATKTWWVLSTKINALVTETGAASTGPAVVSQGRGRSVQQSSVMSLQAVLSHSSFSVLIYTTHQPLQRPAPSDIVSSWQGSLGTLTFGPSCFWPDFLPSTHSSAIRSPPLQTPPSYPVLGHFNPFAISQKCLGLLYKLTHQVASYLWA